MSETSLFESLEKLLKEEKPFALVTLVEGPNTGAKILVQPFGEEVEGTLGNEELDRVAIRDALGELAAGRSGIRHYGQHGEAREETVQVFIESFAPPPQMLIFGAVDFTGALVKVAKVLGYRVTVCDAREVFATKKRFPQADEVIAEWPNRLIDQVGPSLNSQDAICILTHDNKFDVPAVLSSLKTQGITTHARRSLSSLKRKWNQRRRNRPTTFTDRNGHRSKISRRNSYFHSV